MQVLIGRVPHDEDVGTGRCQVYDMSTVTTCHKTHNGGRVPTSTDKSSYRTRNSYLGNVLEIDYRLRSCGWDSKKNFG